MKNHNFHNSKNKRTLPLTLIFTNFYRESIISKNFILEGASDVWIGLNDQQEQNFFEWINGEVTMYTNWNVNQPANTNSANENCVMINQTVSFHLRKFIERLN